MSDLRPDLTPAEAAERLGRSHTYVLRLLERGTLAGRRLGPDSRGGRWLVDAASVAALKAAWDAAPPRRGRPPAANPSPVAAAQRQSRAKRTRHETESIDDDAPDPARIGGVAVGRAWDRP